MATWTLVVSLPAFAGDDTSELESLLATPVYAASKYQQSLADAPAAITVLTQGEIRAFGWRTLAEILAAVRGVYRRYDRGYSYLGVRGLGRPGDYSSRLLLLIDGVRVNDNIYDSVLSGREFPLDVDLIERVEFIAGPGSAVYGSNAVLGTINLVTRDTANLRGLQAVAAGDSQQGWKLGLSSGYEYETGSLLLAASFEDRPGETLAFPEFDTPATPGGVVSNMDAESAAKFFARYSGSTYSFSGLASSRRKAIPNAPYGLVFGDPAAKWVDSLQLAGMSWHPEKTNDEGWYAHMGVGRYTYDDHGRFEPDSTLTRTRNLGVWWYGEANRTQRIGAAQLLLFGLDMQWNAEQQITAQDLDPILTPRRGIDVSGTRLGAYFTDEITVGNYWKLGLGVRLDRTVEGDWKATPRLSMVWKANSRFVAKLLLGQAYREPNVYERVPDDLVSAWNADLQRERVASAELALDWQATDRLRLSGSVFHNDVSRMIEQIMEPGTGVLTYSNVDSAVARGIEAEAEYVDARGWRVRSSVVGQKVSLASGLPISNSPRALFKLHFTAPIAASPARVAVELQGMSSRLTEAGARLPGSLLANVSLSWQPPGRPWSVSTSVYNLLGRKVFDPTSTEYVGDRVEQDGRVVAARLYVSF